MWQRNKRAREWAKSQIKWESERKAREQASKDFAHEALTSFWANIMRREDNEK